MSELSGLRSEELRALVKYPVTRHSSRQEVENHINPMVLRNHFNVASQLMLLGPVLSLYPQLLFQVFGLEPHKELGALKLLGLVCSVLGLQYYSEARYRVAEVIEVSMYSRLVVGAVLILCSRFQAGGRVLLLLGIGSVYSSLLSFRS